MYEIHVDYTVIVTSIEKQPNELRGVFFRRLLQSYILSLYIYLYRVIDLLSGSEQGNTFKTGRPQSY